MNQTKSKSTTQTPDQAEALVEALEQIALGSDISAAARAADDSIAAKRASAVASLFQPVALSDSAAAWVTLTFHHDRAPRDAAGFARSMANLFEAAIAGQPAVADLVRTIQIRSDVASMALPSERDAAVATFDRLIAAALVEANHELAAHAQALLEADRLVERVAAVRVAHAEHAAEVERERVAAELEAKRAGIRELEAAVAEIEAEPVTNATAAAHEYRLIAAKGKLLAARLRGSGVETLRFGRALYDATSIAASAGAGQLGLEQIDRYMSALVEAGA